MSYQDDDSDQLNTIAVLVSHVRELRKFKESSENRLRNLEDYNLAQRERHKQLIVWLTIACTSLSGAVDLLIHILKAN